jgi:hypothetical protein
MRGISSLTLLKRYSSMARRGHGGKRACRNRMAMLANKSGEEIKQQREH